MNQCRMLVALLKPLYQGLNCQSSPQLSRFITHLNQMNDVMQNQQERLKKDIAQCIMELSEASKIGTVHRHLYGHYHLYGRFLLAEQKTIQMKVTWYIKKKSHGKNALFSLLLLFQLEHLLI